MPRTKVGKKGGGASRQDARERAAAADAAGQANKIRLLSQAISKVEDINLRDQLTNQLHELVRQSGEEFTAGATSLRAAIRGAVKKK